MKLLPVFFLCFSCHAFTLETTRLPQVVRFHCDPALTATFVTQFEKWNNAASGYFTLVESDADAANIDVEYGNFLKKFIGEYTLGHIYINPIMQLGVNPDTVILHEIGHALGLDHSSIDSALMFPVIGIGKPPELTQDDIDGVRAAYGLAPVELSSFQIAATGAAKTRVFSTTGYAVTWDFGDGTTGKGQKTKHRYATNGVYDVTANYLGFKRSLQIQVGRVRTVRRVAVR